MTMPLEPWTHDGRYRVRMGRAPQSPVAPRNVVLALTFAPWRREDDDGTLAPDGPYSRSVWLPVLGPSSWLIWTTLADRLRGRDADYWSVRQLAAAHGLGHKEDARGTAPAQRALDRLVRFGILATDDKLHYRVRLSAPTKNAATKPEGGHI